MCRSIAYFFVVPLVLLSSNWFGLSVARGDDAATPKFSSFAAASDLGRQLAISMTDLEKALASESEFKDQPDGRFAHDADTIMLVALALGLHDEDNPYKSRAVGIIAAAKTLAAAKGYEDTKKAFTSLKGAIDSDNKVPGELKWGKVAKFHEFMTYEVQNVNSKIRNGARHFKKRSGDLSAHAATVALMAVNAKLYVGETKLPNEEQKWAKFSDDMREAAIELAARSKAKDEDGAKKAVDRLDEACHACHKLFNPSK